MTTSSENPSAIPLDYGHEPSRWKKFWARVMSLYRRWEDRWFRSIGYAFAAGATALGGASQLTLAFGLAFLAGGMGLAIEGYASSSGPFWMWLGGFLVGLAIPLPKKPGK